MSFTIAWTGHRPEKIGGFRTPNATEQKIRQKVCRILVDLAPDVCIVGMALGVDQLVAEECVKAGIPFIAAVPCPGQDSLWPEQAKKRYRALLDKAVEVVIVSPSYSPLAMQKRNEWMVDHADALVAIWDGSSGGTANCVKYAIEKHQFVSTIPVPKGV